MATGSGALPDMVVLAGLDPTLVHILTLLVALRQIKGFFGGINGAGYTV